MKRVWYTAAVIWATSLLGLYASIIFIMAERPAGTDFYKFHISAKSYVNGATPYWPAPNGSVSHCNPSESELAAVTPDENFASGFHEGQNECLHPNLNPPIFVILTAPFGSLDFLPAWWAWAALSLLAGCFGVYTVVRELNPRHWRRWIAAATFLILSWHPVLVNVQFGQLGLWLLLVMALAWRQMRNDRAATAGLILGAAASIKLFIGLFIVVLLFERRWRTSAFFALSFASITLSGLAIIGPNAYREYASLLGGVDWHANNWNASLTGLFFRLFGGANTAGLYDATTLAKVLVNLCCVLVLWKILAAGRFISAAAGLERRCCPDLNKLRADSLFAMTLCAMLLMSPLGWIYYFPVLLIPVAICNHYAHKRSLKDPTTLGLIMFLLFTAAPFTLRSTASFNGMVDWWWTGSLYSYALMILFVTVIVSLKTVASRQQCSPKGCDTEAIGLEPGSFIPSKNLLLRLRVGLVERLHN